jgi:hypothetical protein
MKYTFDGDEIKAIVCDFVARREHLKPEDIKDVRFRVFPTEEGDAIERIQFDIEV